MRHYKHHFKSIKLFVVLLALACVQTLAAATQNPPAVTALLNRIGGDGTADRFVTIADESISSNGKEAFVITSQEGKPCIKGSNISAVTTGINWYLNHYAHVNLSWNNLTTDLSSKTLPVPTTDETHESSVDYRYYLNYCTFSYSMSVWTWDRWQKEIDWMALHGINMPLQIVGLDVVWRNLLVNDLGYTKDEANAFIAGPCFQAWWGMNNLEGWGGPNPDWWYTRQEALAKKILARERELGMQPVLPGYAGMVPSNIESKKGYKANNQGNWCNFVRPYILDPNSTAFTEISALYYKRLEELMGTSEYYSMDPFHEGANTDGIDVASAYSKIADAMYKANSNGKWVIQFWQWSGAQYNVLDKVEKGKLIVLDLFSDAHTHFGKYQGHDAVYCALPNFGGRTGMFGRLSKIMTDFFAQKSTHSNIKGIGATPEAIEQVPVLYDALFELPWRSSAPDPKAWLAAYSTSRYGTANANAEEAWEKMRNSALNCQTALQGPHEAVLCARPNLSVDKVSSWGGTEIFYNAQDVLDAAYKMLQAKGELSGENYSYDLTDFARQALTDYGYYLLKGINEAATSNNATAYATRRDAYLQLILDLDALLNTNSNFMLGRWTNMARNIADEANGTTESDKQWLELNNARTLITTWGGNSNSEGAGLRDYSYREWGGMLKDFYYKRWKAFFDNRDNGTTLPNWFDNDWAWAHNASLSYSNQPTGNTADVATELFGKYFITVSPVNASSRCFYRYISTDLGTALNVSATRGATYTFPTTLPTGVTATLSIDFNNDGTFGEGETADGLTINVPNTAIATQVAARLTLNDGTTADFSILLKDNITTARTVTVNCDNKQGSVAIEGSDALSVTNTEAVSLKATPAGSYDFKNWTDANGNVTTNTYDALNRVLTANTVCSDTSKNVSKSYVYDNMGRVRSKTANGVQTSYQYDSLGRAYQELSPKSFKGYFYEGISQDAKEQLVGINHQTMYSSTQYEYDAEMRIAQVKESGNLTATYTYDANGNKVSETLANGVVSTYTYNGCNKITKLVTKSGNSTISEYEYSYYLDGSDACKVRNESGIIETTSYDYDGLKRLTKESISNGKTADTYSYEYDDYGNRSKMVANGSEEYETVYDYTVNGKYTALLQKEIKTVEETSNATISDGLAISPTDLITSTAADAKTEETAYSYDANGNQITKTAESKTEINTYDGLNQLIGFTDGETTASYKYNADGLRTSKTVDGKTINHIWDGNKQIVVDMDDSDWYSAEVYVRGTNLLAKFSKQSGNVKTDYQYYTQNAHGDVVDLTDADGEIVKLYIYDAFGVEKNIDDENMNGNLVYRAGAYEYYDVTYWQPEEGVILYNYSRKKLNAEEMAYETLLLLLFTSAAYSGSGVGQPAPAMQPAI